MLWVSEMWVQMWAPLWGSKYYLVFFCQYNLHCRMWEGSICYIQSGTEPKPVTFIVSHRWGQGGPFLQPSREDFWSHGRQGLDESHEGHCSWQSCHQALISRPLDLGQAKTFITKIGLFAYLLETQQFSSAFYHRSILVYRFCTFFSLTLWITEQGSLLPVTSDRTIQMIARLFLMSLIKAFFCYILYNIWATFYINAFMHSFKKAILHFKANIHICYLLWGKCLLQNEKKEATRGNWGTGRLSSLVKEQS